MGLFGNGFFLRSNPASSAEMGQAGLPVIYPFAIDQDVFNKADLVATYVKILTDVAERTHGLTQDQENTLWDSCVKDQSAFGLISLLSQAMTEMSDLFLVYRLGVIRKATYEEEEKIKQDYQRERKSSAGVFISFKNYSRTEMLRVYSSLEYCILNSLNTSMNLSKAIQVKVAELRAAVALSDASVPSAQAKSIADALRCGLNVMLDAKDSIETAAPEIEPTEKAMAFLDNKKAFILSLPMSYISGTQTGGIGSTGEADMRAVERGLKQYFKSIMKPTLNALFGVETEFKSQDFRELGSGLEALKTLELVSEELMSLESKRLLVARLFDLDPKAEEKLLDDPSEAPAPQRRPEEEDGN